MHICTGGTLGVDTQLGRRCNAAHVAQASCPAIKRSPFRTAAWNQLKPPTLKRRQSELTVCLGLEPSPELAVFDLRFGAYTDVRAKDRVLDLGAEQLSAPPSLSQ